MSVRSTVTGGEISKRWPHIRRYLRVESSGWVEDDYLLWFFIHETVSLPDAEVAAVYVEWADFYEFCLEQRADALAGDRLRRYLLAKWTDSMTYCLRREAARARGEEPGEWVPSWERRPDLEAEGRVIRAEIEARLDAEREPVRHVRRVG